MRPLAAELSLVAHALPERVTGVVSALRGPLLLVDELPLPAGALVSVLPARAPRARIPGEVVGFASGQTMVMLLAQGPGIAAGDRVRAEQAAQTALVSDRMLGRCINALGEPIDALGPIRARVPMPLDPDPIAPLARGLIREALPTGVRAIDLFATLGRGQRMGIFAGPGVGKSSLLGQIARADGADANVIALIGERGREVREFIERSLGPAGLARSAVVIATGDESPLMRVRAAKLACSIAEHLRDQGRGVMLMMDSITRFAHALRQIGLAVGEPPATKGYTPSVFAGLALLLERAGAVERADGRAGSITGLYTVLVEGDDLTGDPVSDAARGILDGHIVLSRRLAQAAHFPAIDVLDSVSRVADEVSEPAHVAARRQLVRLLAKHREIAELVQIGAYTRGASAESDVALDIEPDLRALLQQGREEREPLAQARARMVSLAVRAGDALAKKSRPRAA